MQGVLVEVALWADEDVLEESTEMLPELDSVVDLHRPCGLVEGFYVAQAVGAVAISA